MKKITNSMTATYIKSKQMNGLIPSIHKWEPTIFSFISPGPQGHLWALLLFLTDEQMKRVFLKNTI